MRLRPDQLPQHLQRNGLSPLYFVSGDEPLQLLEVTDEIRGFAREHGCTERRILTVSRGFDWDQLRLAGGNMSLFSDQQLIELRLGDQKPGKDGGAALIAYTQDPGPSSVLLISAGKVDRRTQQTKWFKALDGAGVTIQVWPIGADRLPGWITQRVRRQGKTIDAEAAALIADRVEGNLLAAKQDIDKLCLLVDSGNIGVMDVMATVSDSARFDVFSLLAAAFLGNGARVVRMLRGLRSEGNELLALLGAVQWQLRPICTMAAEIASGDSVENVMGRNRVWEQNRDWTRAALRTLDRGRVRALIRDTAAIDRAAKGLSGMDPWMLMEKLLCGIASGAGGPGRPSRRR